MPLRLKINVLVVLFLFLAEVVQAQQLYPMRKMEKWGYINDKGDWIIEPKYLMAHNFSDGLAIVKDTYQGGEVWDIINDKGQKVIQSEYFGYGTFLKLYDYKVTIRPNQVFTEGLVPVSIEILDQNYRGETVSGWLNKQGELELYGYYDEVHNFHEGLARVRKGAKFGYINPEGDFVIRPTYIGSGYFSHGLAPAQDEATRQWGFINRKGEWAIKPQFSKVKEFSNGLAAVWKDFKWGYISPEGETIIEPQYRAAGNFVDGYAFISTEKQNFYINRQGKAVFSESLYKNVCYSRPFTNGAAMLSVAPEGQACQTFKLTDEVVMEDTNQLIYINTQGEIFYTQPKEEFYKLNKIRPPQGG